MTRWWRWTVAVLLCGAGVGLLPTATATASPAVGAGVGTVVADLGTVASDSQPGFSGDGGYYAYLAPSGDRCDVHVYDVKARAQVALTHAHVLCSSSLVRWAAAADTLVWQVDAAAGDAVEYAWDADPGTVSALAPDAHLFATLIDTLTPTVSADGRYLAFTGSSDSHPAPAVDAPRYAGYVYDRAAGVSLPISTSDTHVQFVAWGPTGHNFVAETGGRTPYDQKTGACFGSGTSCRVLSGVTANFGALWSRDGTAVIGSPGAGAKVYDFTTDTLSAVPTTAGEADHAEFIGPGADQVFVDLPDGTGVWDRRTGTIVRTSVDAPAYPSPTARYVLVRQPPPDTYSYLNLSSGASAPATFRGGSGYWTQDGSSYLGVGPGGCSSLRQWSPATNTVSLFGPPARSRCFAVPSTFQTGTLSSASGRFALVEETGGQEYLADLRRHVLTGPLVGGAEPFAPAGPDLLAVDQTTSSGSDEVLLVDPTPAPDVDDKPRWSVATPATGARVDAGVGERVHVQLGASDLQGTPVNLYFRWRDSAGTPIASAPKGWSCDRRRLAAGATVADCTFAPPHDYTATRFVDVSATNFATGAQSDTRSYRVRVGS